MTPRVLTVDAGYSVLLSVASAFFIFAGSMQLVMIPMMTSGASLITLALMTFFINARHIFYGIGFVEKYRRMGWKAPYMIVSIFCLKPEMTMKRKGTKATTSQNRARIMATVQPMAFFTFVLELSTRFVAISLPLPNS